MLTLTEAIREAESVPLVPAEALRVSRDRLQQLGAGGLGRGSAEAQGQIGGMMADLQAGAAAMAACGGVWEARCVIVW